MTKAHINVLMKLFKGLSRTLVKSPYKKKSYFSTKTYVVGTQKNCRDEKVVMSIQNEC